MGSEGRRQPKTSRLAPPSCPLGYTDSDLQDFFTPDALIHFSKWMDGQTMMLCGGFQYDHELGEYLPDACAGNPHGAITYVWDLKRYLSGLPVID